MATDAGDAGHFLKNCWRLVVAAAFVPIAWAIDFVFLRALPPKRNRILGLILLFVAAAAAFVLLVAFEWSAAFASCRIDIGDVAAKATLDAGQFLRASWAKSKDEIAALLVGYILLRGGQLGADVANGRVSWPRQVFTAARKNLSSAVFGNGGTGKTTLIDLLYHRYVQSRISVLSGRQTDELGGEEMLAKFYEGKVVLGGGATPYVVTGGSRRLRVGFQRTMIDLPGQAWYHTYTDEKFGHEPSSSAWTTHIEALLRDHEALFINTMTYGYGAAINRTAINEAWRKDYEGYRNHVRKLEQDALRYLIGQMERVATAGRVRARRIYFVNLVNMAGFWWPERENVQLYYENLDAWNALEGIEFGRGVSMKCWKFVPASLKFDNFRVPAPDDSIPDPSFRVDEESRLSLTHVTYQNLQFIERLLYGAAGKPAKGAEYK